MNWIRLLEPVLGPFSGPIERRVAIKRANQSFGHIAQFIKEFNETLFQGLPAGLVSSAGVSLSAWSRQGDDIISSLSLRSLRKQEMIIPLRITVARIKSKLVKCRSCFLTARECWVLLRGPSLVSSRLKQS